MAANKVTIQTIVRTGLEATYEAASADGHYWENTGKEFIHLVNGVTEGTITIVTPGTVDGHAIADLTVVCTASEERMIGPFPAAVYEDDNKITFSFDVITDMTLAVIKLGSLAY